MILTCFKGLINLNAPAEWGQPEFSSFPGEAWIRFPKVGRAFSIQCKQDGPEVWPSITELSEEESSEATWHSQPCSYWCSHTENLLFGRSAKIYPLT